MKIVWSPTARNRLVEILDYVAKDNLDAALNLIENIESSVFTLAQNPLIGRTVPEIDNSQVREIVISENYGVIYEMNNDRIEVLTIRHFKRMFTGKGLKDNFNSDE